MRLERFSQHGEERFIEQYLGNLDNGTYVDIGSGDPIEISNTYALYKIGWRGILVEPYFIYHEKILKERPEDKLCKKVITHRTGTMKMYDTAQEDTIIGKDYSERLRPDGSKYTEYTAECYGMDSFLEEYPEAKTADFVSIDIETGEEFLFRNCDFNIFKPTLMCVEKEMRSIDYRNKWEHYLKPFYDAKELIGGNAFYLRKS